MPLLRMLFWTHVWCHVEVKVVLTVSPEDPENDAKKRFQKEQKLPEFLRRMSKCPLYFRTEWYNGRSCHHGVLNYFEDVSF